ncbi:MAG: hypothetical protein ABIN80_28700 [Dyadobacter sp.]|uniref:hypothetical protein n=1 Tax=Dyadobacter sp. TaxID=1914288 RepID=UPI00326644D9
MSNKIELWFKKKKNRRIAFLILGAVCWYFYVKNKAKEEDSTAGYSQLVFGTVKPTPPATGGTSFPEIVVNADGAKGVYQMKSANDERTLTSNHTGEFVLVMNADGTVSDTTPGLNTSGAINTLNGKNVFYGQGGAPFYNMTNNSYSKLQNVWFEDGIGTLTQYVCDQSHTPTLAAFIDQYDGYNDGITELNAHCSRINFSIHSKTRVGVSIDPKWLVPSRTLIFQSALQPKNWAQWDKFFGHGQYNRGDAHSRYQAVGAFPHTDWGKMTPQPETFMTAKVGQGQVMNESEWYEQGRNWAVRLGKTKRAFYTSEFGENAQGKDPDTFIKSKFAGKGYMDVLNANGITEVKGVGQFYEYGSFDFTGFWGPDFVKCSRPDYEKNLTTHLHKGWGNQGGGVFGFSALDHEYYREDLIKYGGMNSKYYMWNRRYLLPYEFLNLNEKGILGCKTWQNIGYNRDIVIFSAPAIESFVMDNQGNKINIEETLTGEVQQFPGGKFKARMNTHPAAPWDEFLTMGAASTLILSGMTTWDSPGASLGTDPNKVFIYDTPENPNTQPMEWMPNGSNDWQPYVSGQNGAPVNSPDGLNNTLLAAPIDASAAGMEAIWPVRNRMESIKHVAYTSSRGDFNPTPGETGYHIAGHGPINYRQFTARDLVEQKKAVSLHCAGGDGEFIYFYNGFLCSHEYQDVVCKGKSFRAFGRKTYMIPL